MIIFPLLIAITTQQVYPPYQHKWTQKTICNEGDYLFALTPQIQLCITCQKGCLQCCDPNLCVACDVGYLYNTTTSACQRCPNYCTTCKKGKVLMECVVCEPGFILQKDGECRACKDNCVDCSSPTQCKKCGDGFYLFNEECKYCIFGCKECQNHPQCESCMDGYYLSGTDCINCPNGCTKCSSETQCSECHNSFIMKNTMCEKCIENCEYCNQDNGECYQCYEGYMLSDNKKECSGCPESLCVECKLDDPHFCLRCSIGFDAVDGVCVQCLNNCAKCSAYITCETCNDGLFVGEDNMCQYCIPNCKTCKNDKVCEVCDDGYYADGDCKLCQNNCIRCSSATFCNECYMGYYFNGFDCIQCSVGCEKCNYNGECLKCTYGYYVGKGECVPCSNNICQCSVLQEIVEKLSLIRMGLVMILLYLI